MSAPRAHLALYLTVVTTAAVGPPGTRNNRIHGALIVLRIRLAKKWGSREGPSAPVELAGGQRIHQEERQTCEWRWRRVSRAARPCCWQCRPGPPIPGGAAE